MRLLTLISILLFSAPALSQTLQSPLERHRENLARGGTPEPGALLLSLSPGLDPSRTLDALPACALDHRVGQRPLFRVRCDPALDLEGVIAQAQALPEVAWVEAGFYEEEEAQPNDLTLEQWHHHNTGQTIDGVPGLAGADIGSLEAWDQTTGERDVVVAIIDSGLFGEHPDLRAQIWQNTDEICDNGVDDDANGYIDDCVGWDIGNQDPDPDPRTLPLVKASGSDCRRTHGTFMAGVLGAEGNNGTGTTGVVWNASLINLKKHDDGRCSSTSSDSIEAIAYALDAGARILVLSFNSSTYSDTFQALLNEADARGVLTVMSAGNDAEVIDGLERYPNTYDLQHKLIVANTTNEDLLSTKSNHGTTVHIAAPGNDIYATALGQPDLYETRSGTSYATPMVAGAAALVWSAYPNLSAADVTTALLTGSHPLEALDCARTTRCVSSGARLDLPGVLAVAATLVEEPTETDPAPGSDVGSSSDTTTSADAQVEPPPTRRSRRSRCACQLTAAPASRPAPGLLLLLLPLFAWWRRR